MVTNFGEKAKTSSRV